MACLLFIYLDLATNSTGGHWLNYTYMYMPSRESHDCTDYVGAYIHNYLFLYRWLSRQLFSVLCILSNVTSPLSVRLVLWHSVMSVLVKT